jgi:hypothetical protein
MSKDLFRQAGALTALVNQERAGAMGLTGQRLERELAEAQRLRRAFTEADLAARPRLARLLEDAEAEVARQLWRLMVQREAMGLTRHDEVYETYRIPRSVVPRPF